MSLARRAASAGEGQLLRGPDRPAAKERPTDAATWTAVDSARLKLEVLAQGLRVDTTAEQHVVEHGKPPLRVRSGSCGGLDLVLPAGVWVNAPVHELFAPASPLGLVRDGGGLALEDGRDGSRTPVQLPPAPDYYAQRTASGRPMSAIGQLCSDRLGIGLTNGCVYWGPRETRCRFCSIGLNVRTGHEDASKQVVDILEVVNAAVHDGSASATHVLLGGGTPPGPDAGALAFAAVTRRIKERHAALPVYVMLAPPQEVTAIDALVEAGADEIGINLELVSAAAGEAFMPAKASIGRDRWSRALGRAVELLGPGRPLGAVRSILIVGLEDEEHTLAGVEELAAAGVMPILTPFRPMRGTVLERHPRWTGERLWQLCVAATEVAARHGQSLGPLCVPCQANTLNLPAESRAKVLA